MNNVIPSRSSFGKKLAQYPELKKVYEQLAQKLRKIAKEEAEPTILDPEKLPPILWIL